MSEIILSANHLSKSFGTLKAVDDLSFLLHKGECLALLGANGAGKSTTIRMLYGFQTPDQGSIHFFQQDFQQNRYQLKALIGVCNQEDNLDYDFTVQQNLEIFAGYFGLKIKDVQDHILYLLKMNWYYLFVIVSSLFLLLSGIYGVSSIGNETKSRKLIKYFKWAFLI